MTPPLTYIKVITWIDSTVQNGQVDKTDFPEPVLIKTVGFIAKETDSYIVLARDNMGDGEYRGLCAIPKFAIVEED